MRYNKLLSWVSMAIVLLVSCQNPKDTCIKIVCTGDVHGQLFTQDFLTGDTIRGGLARVSSYLKEQRQHGANVVYLDNGDMIQGSPATYCYNTYAVGYPHVAAEALNYLGCDVVVLGNNDIEPGGPTYQRYISDLDAAVVGGNILYRDTETPFLPPYTIVEREGVKIAVVGLTTPAVSYWVPKCQWTELEFEDMERSASRWMQHLREKVNPDIVIGLFHSGYDGGLITDSYTENATRMVAERVPGFDAIFYGHDHQAHVEYVINTIGDTVWLLNPGKNAHKLATLDITRTKGGKQTLIAELVDMDGYKYDELYMNTFASHIERISNYVDCVIGTSACAATMDDALLGPSALVDFMHKMQLDVSGAKVSFVAPLIPEDGRLPKGEVKVSDVYRLYPYENHLYVLWLTGREIKDYLELSYDRWIKQLAIPSTHPQFDSAAGVIYEVSTTKPMGRRVDIKYMADGSPFDMDKRYMVAMNSFRAHGGDTLMTEGAGITHEELHERIVYSTTVDLRFYMINYIEMRGSVAPEVLGQWKFVP